MNGTEMAELLTFLEVAKHRSFSRAAIQRSVAPSAVSHAIRSLEQRVGVRLFNRTTRNVSLTDAGERFASELRPAFEQIDTALDNLNTYRDTPFGTVRLNVSISTAPMIMEGVMGRILSENPGLNLDIVATDSLSNIVEDGFDAGIRFGETLSNDMVAIRIKHKLRFAVVGAPGYLTGRRTLTTPADLQAHDCIRYRFPSGTMLNWHFAKGDEAVDVDVKGPITLESQELMVEAALQGCGLAYVWENRVAQHLASGRLVRSLEDWCPVEDDLYLYYPSRKHVSAGLRALIVLLTTNS